MVATFLWSTWSGRGWPASVVEEERFVAALGDHAPDGSPVDRDTLTLVVTALRDGVSVPELCSVAPHVDLAELHAAYSHLDGLRRRAVEAWEAIAVTADVDQLAGRSVDAALILPVAVGRLLTAASRGELASQLEAVCATVDAARSKAWRVEAELMHPRTPVGTRRTLAQVLHHPYRSGLWGDPYYLPRRVGDLCPLRIKYLLEEPTA